MSFGPNPWQQTNWDWRAAGNFMGGGAGAGLVVWSVLSGAHPALLVIGLALIGAGLLCVWAEIGRPLRALHVFFNPQTSWMTREGLVAMLLMPVGLASAVLWPQLAPAAALLAVGFIYCQARILHMAKGIPAWREPRVVPLIVATGLVEGGGLLMLVAPGSFRRTPGYSARPRCCCLRASCSGPSTANASERAPAPHSPPSNAACCGAERWCRWR